MDELAAGAMNRGDEVAFTTLVERHRRELRAHCYRMLGSLEDAEDLVQETFLRAWRSRAGFAGASTVRVWLYRIATNACLDVLAYRRRRALPYELSRPADPDVQLPPVAEPVWLQPFPDRLLEPMAPSEQGPDAAVVARETIELTFVATLQTLPARQRAVLVLRDVLGWSSAEVASALDTSVPATNSALQRARATLRTRLGRNRTDWSRPVASPAREREVLARFMAALERADATAIAELLVADARGSMPPYPMWYEGRDTLHTTLARGFDLFGGFKVLATRANRGPAVALYRRRIDAPTSAPFEAVGISVLQVEPAGLTEMTSFMDPKLFAHFALPEALPAG
ncbi:RNA polymerase subunit sigma-70 [Amycolatopsis taiwanensis]|uniref:RNA polymerase sigma factor n=1 Tax=Amycolatopsis taiwanensis TaxID=342230 RepID=A0A9W6R433_9PSEU|nr:RNA polymerase subunit sigma-70 [Amycolatopsis taiwanensis]GLY69131.1 RNA polymerase sigma factor [Amycolatopsis taiwanensis]